MGKRERRFYRRGAEGDEDAEEENRGELTPRHKDTKVRGKEKCSVFSVF